MSVVESHPTPPQRTPAASQAGGISHKAESSSGSKSDETNGLLRGASEAMNGSPAHKPSSRVPGLLATSNGHAESKLSESTDDSSTDDHVAHYPRPSPLSSPAFTEYSAASPYPGSPAARFTRPRVTPSNLIAELLVGTASDSSCSIDARGFPYVVSEDALIESQRRLLREAQRHVNLGNKHLSVRKKNSKMQAAQKAKWLDYVQLWTKRVRVLKMFLKPELYDNLVSKAQMPAPPQKRPGAPIRQTRPSKKQRAAAVRTRKGLCGVCLGSSPGTDSSVVPCHGCGVAVHRRCHPVAVARDLLWMCMLCADRIRRSTRKVRNVTTACKGEQPPCTLCPVTNQRQWAMAPCQGKGKPKWAHLPCVLYINDLNLGEDFDVCGVDAARRRRKNSKKLICKDCNANMGVTTQCGLEGCFTAFHVGCALVNGRKMRVETNADKNSFGAGADGTRKFIYCQEHDAQAVAEGVEALPPIAKKGKRRKSKS